MSTYTFRLWVNGAVVKKADGLEKGEALALWRRWEDNWCCCPELLLDGQRLTRAQIDRMAGQKKKMPKMVLW